MTYVFGHLPGFWAGQSRINRKLLLIEIPKDEQWVNFYISDDFSSVSKYSFNLTN